MNRLLLGLVGLALLALGLGALLGGLDLDTRWNLGLPNGWPWSRPDDVLLGAGDRTRWRDQDWWWPTVIAVLSVLVLVLLWWLLAQLRNRRLTDVLVDSGDGGGAWVRSRALEGAIAAEATQVEGVSRARVALSGSGVAPRARVRLSLDPHARPDEAMRRLRQEALEHARTSAGLPELPAEVRLRAVRHRPERVS
ncbi:alkaline shock response membrane anchor protein AmaP [Streptomyces sp. NPDC005438]|uniref:alkaline shock response membrane anchor protein AmaP n=1 Tax=Streptomyces sp. NPDC005438 TaxID=3156880 RepID=UPI0033AE4F5F